jgi:hypothetical protein
MQEIKYEREKSLNSHRSNQTSTRINHSNYENVSDKLPHTSIHSGVFVPKLTIVSSIKNDED